MFANLGLFVAGTILLKWLKKYQKVWLEYDSICVLLSPILASLFSEGIKTSETIQSKFLILFNKNHIQNFFEI